ncbi:MAG TPA: Txe/YoeB family addiction module toxin [Ignavibacteriaceae bacterium]|nr:Txe/YoeB family addiction module toxin [Ignavibacteriaceae bacterium]
MEKILEVIWSPESLRQKIKIEKTKSAEHFFSKVILLIEDIKKNPFNGKGRPEHLKYKIPPCWSRRINKKDRLIYRIKENQIEIISILGHYEND